MTPESLLRILRDFKVNVTLSPEGNKLILDGRAEVLNQHLPLIREYKNAIIEIIKKEAESVQHDVREIVFIRDENGLLNMERFIHQYNIRKVFIDTETSGLDPFSAELVLVQLMAGNTIFLIDVSSIPADHQKVSFYDGLKRIMEDKTILKVFHNGLFDMKFLKYRLFDNNGIRFLNLFDTMLAEQLLTAGISKHGDHSLKSLCRKYLNIDLDKGLQTSFKPGQPFSEDQIQYATNDVKHLEAIFRIQANAIAKEGLTDTALLEFAITPAIVNIELAGVHLNINKLEALKVELPKEKSRIEQGLNDIVKAAENIKISKTFNEKAINFNSPVQVKQILRDLGFDVPGTGIEVIEKINHPFTKALVEYRKVSKLLSSFCDKLPKHVHAKTGRIHPEFFQLGTEAGRFTCQKPNIQQIPHKQEWRDLFSAPEGRKIITADYSQIELRILAEFSQDPAFLDAYRNGQDLHSRTASEMFNVPIDQVNKDQRGIAKTINFGLCYGMQMAVIEFARHACNLKGANSEEVDKETLYSVIHIMPEQEKLIKEKGYGGTIRLGGWPCKITPNTHMAKAYQKFSKEKVVSERHRHRYEFNNDYRSVFEKNGMTIAGTSPDGQIVEAIEITKHPFFIGTQFHPEYISRPLAPHPLFVEFVKVCKEIKGKKK